MARREGYGTASALSDAKVTRRGDVMLWIVLIVLLVLWLLGFIGNIGWFVHLLLVIALIVLLFQLLSGRRAV